MKSARIESKSFVVGVKIPQWATFARHVVKGVVDYLVKNAKQWEIQIDGVVSDELEPVSIDESWEGDGLIVFRVSPEELESYAKRGIKVVNISAESFETGVHTVVPNDYEGAALAANFFVGLGFEHFAFWGDREQCYSRVMENGFRSVISKHGKELYVLECNVENVPVAERWKVVAESIQKELKALPKPIAIYTKDDVMGRAVLAQCNNLGFAIPDEVALVGCNNENIFCYTSRPSMSSVEYPGEEVGYTASRVLNALMQGKDVIKLIQIPVTKLQERESTNVLVYKDALVAKVVSYIRKRAGSSAVHVSHISKHFGVSRSNIQSRVRKVVGRTPKELIDEVREKRVRYLLENTELRVKEIAFEMGFASANDLGRFIKRVMGMTAHQYRERR